MDSQIGGFAALEDDNAIARYGGAELEMILPNLHYRPPSVQVTVLSTIKMAASVFDIILVYYQVQAAANREAVGAFGDASLGRLEYGAGNIVGIHVDPNLNTGIGIRNGNVEAHLMGFGGKVGEDGLEINTPLGGANACNVM